MRIYTKKLLSFLLVLALLLSTMNVVLSVFAAETGVNLQLNGGTLQGSSEIYNAGDALPDSATITRAGAAFGGWYAEADFSGSRIYSVPADAAADATYYARWIYHDVNFDDFESYDTDADMLNANHWLDWKWPAENADISLNTDASHANNGGKSMKIVPNEANKDVRPISPKADFSKTGDGVAFWIESVNGATVKLGFNEKNKNPEFQSQAITVQAGKHIVLIPWSELGEAINAGYLWRTWLVVSVSNASDVVYIDDIGTYADYAEAGKVSFNLNGGTWANGFAPYEGYTEYGLKLPDTADVKYDGLAFAGWYDNAALTGSPVYSIPAGTSGDKEYWAKWIVHDVNYDNFDSYDTYDDLAYVWWNWSDAGVAESSVNTDLIHSNSGKSMKIDIAQANKNAYFLSQRIESVRTGDGIAFWIESKSGVTVKFRLVKDKNKYEFNERFVPSGKHIVTFPWTEIDSGYLTESYLNQHLFIKTAKAGETVYIDDMGTYAAYVECGKVSFNLNGGAWADGFAPAATYYTDGLNLPDTADVKYDGLAFAGWYDNAELTGSPVYSIASGTMGDKEYWAKWIVHSVNFDDFESYNTDEDMLNADHWSDWKSPATNAVTTLNTDSSHANNSEKSMKIMPNEANKEDRLVVSRVNFSKTGDGVALWIESADGATVKLGFNEINENGTKKPKFTSQTITLSAGKKIVIIPWSELGDAKNAAWLWETWIFVSVPNAGDAVYIDDIGTYAELKSETVMPNRENGFSHFYDENGRNVWNYSKASGESSYIGFTTNYVLEKDRNYVIAFEYKYLKDARLAQSIEPQAVGETFDESEINAQTDEKRETLNSRDLNSDWATKKTVFKTADENKYLAFFGKTEAGSEYDISIKNIRLYDLGDVDFSGKTDASDMAALKKSLLGADNIAEFTDINNDGKTDILDLISLKKLLAK